MNFEASFLTLPLQGQKKSDCGDFSSFKACPITSHTESVSRISKHCLRPSCPVCGGHWAVNKSEKIVDRLFSSKDLFYAAGLHIGGIRHIVVSPPQPDIARGSVFGMSWDKILSDIDTFRKYRMKFKNFLKDFSYLSSRSMSKDDKRFLKNSSLKGGVDVFHVFRATKTAKMNAKKDNVKTWEWVMCQEDIKKWIYVSPHHHLFVFGRLPDSSRFYDLTGWVYYNADSHGSKRDYESLKKSVCYALSHCSIPKDTEWDRLAAYSYFGCVSTRVVVIDRDKSEIEKGLTLECPEEGCSELLHKYSRLTAGADGGLPGVWSDDNRFTPAYLELDDCSRWIGGVFPFVPDFDDGDNGVFEYKKERLVYCLSPNAVIDIEARSIRVVMPKKVLEPGWSSQRVLYSQVSSLYLSVKAECVLTASQFLGVAVDAFPSEDMQRISSCVSHFVKKGSFIFKIDVGGLNYGHIM